MPTTLPVTVEQFATLVQSGTFDQTNGQIELIRGMIVKMNPQGPQHSDPVDIITEWSFEQSQRRFRIRCEKPIALPQQHSTPEPDLAWVKRDNYNQRHPGPQDILLIIEVSQTSQKYDGVDKRKLYAEAGIPEYWRFDVPTKSVERFRDPDDGDYRTVERIDPTGTISPLCLPNATLKIANVFSAE